MSQLRAKSSLYGHRDRSEALRRVANAYENQARVVSLDAVRREREDTA